MVIFARLTGFFCLLVAHCCSCFFVISQYRTKLRELPDVEGDLLSHFENANPQGKQSTCLQLTSAESITGRSLTCFA